MIPENEEERDGLEDGSSLSDFESIGENDDLKMFWEHKFVLIFMNNNLR